MRRFLLALSYVTSLPLDSGQTEQETETGLAGLAKYLPAAGLVIGALLASLEWLLRATDCNSLLAGIILGVAWLCITGGLHFDGLMDTADGVFSHRSRERMLEIMTDSRAGNFGILTGVSVLLLKCASMVAIFQSGSLMVILLLTPAWSRWAELYAIASFPYAKEAGKGKIWHDSTRFPTDLIGGAVAPSAMLAVLTVAGSPTLAVVASTTTVISGLIAAHWIARHLDGQTGDTYGAVVELAECGGLVATALILS